MTGNNASLWLLLAGLLTMALSDSTYSYLSTLNSYSPGGLIDVGWIVAYLLIALSAYVAIPADGSPQRVDQAQCPTLLSFLIPFVPALIALIATAIELHLGKHLGNTASVMIVILAGLVILRECLLAVEAAESGHGPDVVWLRTLWRAALGRANTGAPPPPSTQTRP